MNDGGFMVGDAWQPVTKTYVDKNLIGCLPQPHNRIDPYLWRHELPIDPEVWAVYNEDITEITLYASELEALRAAVETGYHVKMVSLRRELVEQLEE